MSNLSSQSWPLTRFGDGVRNVNDNVRDPLTSDLERYVGLDHLDPESLHIKRWGLIADGTTFTRRFVAGQVLFGKRRAYQRKVAVAEFDGICSGDILVFEPANDQLLPELLPFIVQSDGFFQHALGTSAGSLSPRTKWQDLARYEFALPPLDEQRRIAEILWAADEAQRAFENIIEPLANLYVSLFKRVSDIKETDTSLPVGWQIVCLEDLCSHIVDCLHSTPDCVDEGYPVIRTADVVPGRMLVEQARRVSKSTYEERISRLRPLAGDIFYSREGARFGIAAPVPENVEVCLGQRMMHFRANADTDANYLLWLFNSPIIRQQAVAGVIGSASPHVNIREIKQFKVPWPPLQEQRILGSLSRGIAESDSLIHSHIEVLRNLVVGLSRTLIA